MRSLTVPSHKNNHELDPYNRYWKLKQSWPLKMLIISTQNLLGREKYDQVSNLFIRIFLPRYAGFTPFSIIEPKGGLLLKRQNDHLGINLFAHLTLATGVGEAGRYFSSQFNRAGVLSSPVDLGTWTSEIKTKDWQKKQTPLYPFSLFVTSVTGLQTHMRVKLGQASYANKYNIAYFHWELPTLPQSYQNAFRDIDEIWVPSSFCQETFAKFSPVPVVKIPWRPIISLDRKYYRQDFGFSKDDYVFLFVFDGSHYPERKNPIALVNAFKKARLPNNAKLVIKVMNMKRKLPYNQELIRIIKNSTNIYLWDKIFSREKIIDLIAASNCYVSLHHAEGFGATIFEAMALGKPVIATGYSGNMDFMTVNNSFPVKFKLIKTKENIGPYTKGSVWAEPDISDVSMLMRNVYNNQNDAINIGLRAKRDLDEIYSLNNLQKITIGRLSALQEKLDSYIEVGK